MPNQYVADAVVGAIDSVGSAAPVAADVVVAMPSSLGPMHV